MKLLTGSVLSLLLLAVSLAKGDEASQVTISDEALSAENNEVADIINDELIQVDGDESQRDLDEVQFVPEIDETSEGDEFPEGERDLQRSWRGEFDYGYGGYYNGRGKGGRGYGGYRRYGKGKGKGKGGILPCCPCNKGASYYGYNNNWYGGGKRGPSCRRCPCKKPSPSPSPRKDSRIGTTVYNDINGNGRQDAGEPGIGGVTLALYRDGDMDSDCRGRFERYRRDWDGDWDDRLDWDDDDERWDDWDDRRDRWDDRWDDRRDRWDDRLDRWDGDGFRYNRYDYVGYGYGYDTYNSYGPYNRNWSGYGSGSVSRRRYDFGCVDVHKTTITDSTGYYIFRNLRRGTYYVVVTDYNYRLDGLSVTAAGGYSVGYSASYSYGYGVGGGMIRPTGPRISPTSVFVDGREDKLNVDFGYHRRLPCCPCPQPRPIYGKRGKRGYGVVGYGGGYGYGAVGYGGGYDLQRGCRPCGCGGPGKGKGGYYPGKGKGGYYPGKGKGGYTPYSSPYSAPAPYGKRGPYPSGKRGGYYNYGSYYGPYGESYYAYGRGPGGNYGGVYARDGYYGSGVVTYRSGAEPAAAPPADDELPVVTARSGGTTDPTTRNSNGPQEGCDCDCKYNADGAYECACICDKDNRPTPIFRPTPNWSSPYSAPAPYGKRGGSPYSSPYSSPWSGGKRGSPYPSRPKYLPCCPCYSNPPRWEWYGKRGGSPYSSPYSGGKRGKRGGPVCRPAPGPGCPCEVEKCLSSIGDRVFRDRNGDGRLDGDDEGISGVRVTLYREGGWAYGGYGGYGPYRSGYYSGYNRWDGDGYYRGDGYYGGRGDGYYYGGRGGYYGGVSGGYIGDGRVGAGYVSGGYVGGGRVGAGYVEGGYIGDGRVGAGYVSGGYIGDGRVEGGYISGGSIGSTTSYGTVVSTTTTGYDGFYIFRNLCAGYYCIRVHDSHDDLYDLVPTGPKVSVSCLYVDGFAAYLNEDFGYEKKPKKPKKKKEKKKCCPCPRVGKGKGNRGYGGYGGRYGKGKGWGGWGGKGKGGGRWDRDWDDRWDRDYGDWDNCRPCKCFVPGKGKGGYYGKRGKRF